MHVDPIPLLERSLADLVLLHVVIATKADDPAIGRLQPRASVGVTPNMRALNGSAETARHAAMMPAHPGAVSRAPAAIGFARPLAFKPVR